MKRFLMLAAFVCAPVQAQVQCKMPNGIWIERKLSDLCPAGALDARGLDGRPLPLRLPEAPKASKAVPQAPEPVTLRSERQPMPFEACVKLLTQTVLSVGGANTRVVMTAPDVRMLRVCTNDGSVLVTCSRDDAAMVTTASPTRCD
jgi:hypothetical protein